MLLSPHNSVHATRGRTNFKKNCIVQMHVTPKIAYGQIKDFKIG